MDKGNEPTRPFELGYPQTELRKRLVDATLRGVKTATSSLRHEYQPFTDDPMPEVGERFLLLGYEDEPVGVVETTEVITRPAGEIDLQFARDEGEGFETVADWRAGHGRFWAELQIADDSMIVCERFKLVEKF